MNSKNDFKVVVVGRPNVGKSTLFNRLIGRRRSLVHDLPGVTRDRIEGQVDWWYYQKKYSITVTAEWAENILPKKLLPKFMPL